MSYELLRKSLPPRPLSSDEDRNLQLLLGQQLTHAERFQWLCRTVEELRPMLGLARLSPEEKTPLAEGAQDRSSAEGD